MKPILRIIGEVLSEPKRQRRRLHIGPAGSEAMQHHAMKLFPTANSQGRMYNAEQWLAAVTYLRKRRKWKADELVGRLKTPLAMGDNTMNRGKLP